MVNHDLSVIPSEKAELLFCGNTEFPPDHITFKAPRFTAIPIDDTIANRFPEFSIKEKIVKSLNADIPNLVKEDGILVQKKEAVNV